MAFTMMQAKMFVSQGKYACQSALISDIFSGINPLYYAVPNRTCKRWFYMQCPFSPYRFTSHNFLSFQAFVSNSKSYSYVLNMRLRSTFHGQRMSDRKKTIVIYVCSIWVLMLGISYAGVPLYRLFCQATGLGGQAVQVKDISTIGAMKSVPERVIEVRFNADVASSLQWNFKPQQLSVKVSPGETALAFYTATNPTNQPIIGISTYNIVPYEAGQYFNKIQCFCFEEQRLNPHEQVDMPVFFYIDPEYAMDPRLNHINTITLSYTFFRAKDGIQIPLPGYITSAKH